MDLHDFSGENMYFDEKLPSIVSNLLNNAADAYAKGSSEQYLLKAYFYAPKSLTVLVALYRFYYYQHRYEDALLVAGLAIDLVAEKLEINVEWDRVDLHAIGYAVMHSMTLVRFYLLCIKGAGYLCLRLGRIEEGIARLEKVVDLDVQDRLGASALLATVEGYQRRLDANFGKLTVVA